MISCIAAAVCSIHVIISLYARRWHSSQRPSVVASHQRRPPLSTPYWKHPIFFPFQTCSHLKTEKSYRLIFREAATPHFRGSHWIKHKSYRLFSCVLPVHTIALQFQSIDLSFLLQEIHQLGRSSQSSVLEAFRSRHSNPRQWACLLDYLGYWNKGRHHPFVYQQFNFGVASKQLTLDLWRTSTRDFLKRPCRFRKLIAGSESFWLRLIFFFRSLIHGTLIISCGLSFTQKQTTVLSITFIPWSGRPSIADLPRNWIGWNDASFFNDPSVIMKSI